MKLATYTLTLQSPERTSLPVDHGRLLHAALLDLVRQHEPQLSETMHNNYIKPFSLSPLNLKTHQPQNNTYQIAPNTQTTWTINSLHTELTDLLNKLPIPTNIRIGKAQLRITNINTIRTTHTQHIIDTSAKHTPNTSITIQFNTPTTFSHYNLDYPFPRPDLIYGSLTKRWNQINNTITIDPEQIKTIASQHLIPIKWEGKTQRIKLSPQYGVTGFTGTFTFSIKTLPPQYRQLFIILTDFAQYSGIGRLTAQGLGTIKHTYQ